MCILPLRICFIRYRHREPIRMEYAIVFVMIKRNCSTVKRGKNPLKRPGRLVYALSSASVHEFLGAGHLSACVNDFIIV